MRKKLLGSTLVLLLLVIVIVPGQALSPIKIILNGLELDTAVAPLIKNERVLVPVRALAEGLGAEVNWDGENRTVYIKSIRKDDKHETDIVQVVNLVTELGQRLKNVSLLEPEIILMESMPANYGDLVASELLSRWAKDPYNAPGRRLSSPWPEGIEILNLEKTSPNTYEVKGEIIEVTSTEIAQGGLAAKRPLTLIVEKKNEGWLITASILGPYEKTDPLVYQNDQYGFIFTLPETWLGYSVITTNWQGIEPGKSPEESPSIEGSILNIRHPYWTEEKPRQDIPIMVFTPSQWGALERGKFHIGAAPMGPKELDRNDKYIFALPPRYNFAFPEGFEEVEEILEGNPLKVYSTS